MTTGLLQKMDREELQGVLGHELSHIRNYDIRFTLLVGVLVGGVALLSSFFLRYTFWFGGGRKRDSDSGGSGALQIVAFVIAIVLAVVAPIAARAVQLAVSRQREYLADASSRGADPQPARAGARARRHRRPTRRSSRSRPRRHSTCTSRTRSRSSRSGRVGLFSTHPPIVERINRLRELTGEQPLDPADQAALTGLD